MNNPKRFIDRFKLLLFVVAFSAASLGGGRAYAWNHLTPLTNQVVCPGETVTFKTTPSGPTPYKFWWWHDGVLILGATSNSITLRNVTASDAGTYTVKLTGGYDSVTNSAKLTVRTNVSATPLPDLAQCSGDCVIFSTTASGTGPFTYTWKKNGSVLSGKTSSSLTLTSISASDAGTYTVIVKGTCSSVTNSGTLTINAPVLASGLTNLNKCAGDSATFVSTVTGTGPFTYLWKKDGVTITGATKSNLVIANVTATNAGTYCVVVCGACESKATNCATLSVNVPASATSLSNLVLCPGGNAAFSTVASGTGPFAYLWLKNGELIAGATTNNLTLANVTSSDAGEYSVVITGACGRAITNKATLLINQPPLIVAPPSNLTNCPGSSASFSVSATGAGVAYQWYRGNSLLSGTTSSSLTLTNVSGADAGNYSVVVKGTCGSPITNSASLTVNQPLLVVTPPSNLTNCPTTSATFNISVSGTAVGYQWYRGGNPLIGATGASLTLTNVSAADAGIYSVVVSGTCGSPVTNIASLTVNEPLLVVTPPVNSTNCPGSSATFNVSATGTGVSYQWYRGNNLLTGATRSSLTLTNVSAADGGIYRVVVNGACGSPATNTTILTVNQPLLVMTPPVSLTNCPGSSATFSVSATGSGVVYQWYRGNNPLSGATGSSLTLTNVSPQDAGSYSVLISAACGSPVTNTASLTINQPLLVVTPPTNVTNCPGASAAFNVYATGTGVTYQWYRGNNSLSGATGSSLLLTNISAADAGTYAVVVNGACGSPITNTAILTVNQALLVVTPPVSLTNCPGTSAGFNVSASGTGVAYQWYRGNNPLSAATGNSLVLTNVSLSDAGVYSVAVSGTCGLPITNFASLTVNQPLLVVTPPANSTNCPGGSATFSVSATGVGVSYQWYRGNSLLSGATGSSLALTNVSLSDAGVYGVVVSGICGLPITNFASLTVNQPLQIVTPPANSTNCPGGSATFSVSATGAGVTYQWYRGNSLLTGATGSSVTLTNVSATDAGIYRVGINGACGSPVTNVASLTVNQSLLVVTPPASLTNCPGSSVNFNVLATGTGVSYQWYRGNNPLNGATASSLTLTNVSLSDAGVYGVIVSGTCGLPITNFASLTVNQPLLVVTPPVNSTNCPGGTATFSVSATGAGVGYQWYRGNSLLSGATGSSLMLTNVSVGDAGIYRVVISGTCGSPMTNAVSLTVNQRLLVVTPPTNSTNCPGSSATFNVLATGTGVAYQWYRGNNSLTGATGSSLTLTNVSLSDSGVYGVVVNGTCGLPITNFASLTVNQPLLVVTPPANSTNCPGGSATFNVFATGTGVTYQWYRGNNSLTGATGSSLTLTNVNAADAGNYSVVLNVVCGSPVTNVVSLTINEPLLVVTPPTNLMNCPGSSAIFSVSVRGTGVGYQWYRGNNLLIGATGSNLTLTNVSVADAGTYRVVVNGACGSPITNNASLTINQPLLVVTPPMDVTNCPGASARFNVSATGTAVTYQWYRGNTPLSGATASSVTLTNVSAGDAGTYSVVVSGTCGSPITKTALLVVNEPMLVVTSPSNQTNCPGTTATFAVGATGTAVQYQWYQGTELLVGRTGSTLVLTNVSSADAGLYRVVVSGACNAPITNSASLLLNAPVSATALVDVLRCPGESASFGTTASGTGPFSYLWRRNGIILPGQTNSNLSLPNLRLNDVGLYSVEVRGACGTVSNSAFLALNLGTTASPLTSVTNNLGTSVTFNTVAFGTGPFTFVWKKDGQIIVGANSSGITLTNVGFADAGVYTVEVTGACNTAVQSAALTINHPPTVTITSPTNGAVFLALASFPVIADAQDIDGFITNVEFFEGTTSKIKIGEITNVPPYFVLRTNLAVGSYTFTATATDNLGAMGTSAPVSVTVISNLPLVVSGPIRLNYQTGFYEQTAHVTNPTPFLLGAVGVLAYNLPNDWRVQNASFVTNGVAGVLYNQPVPPGARVDVTLKYYLGPTANTNDMPTLIAVERAPAGGVSVEGNPVPVTRGLFLADGTFLLHFDTVAGAIYYVLYSTDLVNWRTSTQPVYGTGFAAQWLDYGPPATESLPRNQAKRFYRVLRVP